MRRNGYDSYHGRSRVRTFLKVLIVLLLVVLAVAVGALLWLEPYIDYSANGIKINLPFFQQKEPAPATGAPVVVTTPEPTPTPEPEEDFRGILLPNSALYDGTAAQQVEAAGATAALFDMKADDGSLGYISGLALAIQAEASAADPALNAAIQLLNGGEVYTVARVSCFRDNLVPRSDMSLAIHTNAGNWRDSGDTRWLSPANERWACAGSWRPWALMRSCWTTGPSPPTGNWGGLRPMPTIPLTAGPPRWRSFSRRCAPDWRSSRR